MSHEENNNTLKYNSLNDYLRKKFGSKLYKLSLNAGFSCPNRDGTLGTGGCIFCSEGGSGDFAASPELTIKEQIASAKQRVIGKMPRDASSHRFIAYFQAYTNTYAPIDVLEKVFMDALEEPEIVALSIATRPDCLSPEVLFLLTRLNKIKPIWVELGLQTIHETTAVFIRRGYPLSTFVSAVDNLHKSGIEIIVHIILGLPKESPDMILETVRFVSNLPVQGIKLQLLHILQNTPLAAYYSSLPEIIREKEFAMMDKNAYFDTLLACLDNLAPGIIIHRLTGDGDKRILLAPEWSGNKKAVLNGFQKHLKESDTFQGRLFKKEEGEV